MTPQYWRALSYKEQKGVLVSSVTSEESLDWLSRELLQVFFEESIESECRLRRFVDVRNLRTFFGNPELDDFDNDFGMDSYQYKTFNRSIFENLREILFNNEESAELLLLDSIGSTFVTQTQYIINCFDEEGESVALCFTTNVFTDGRDDAVVFPCIDLACHEHIDDLGEWMELDGETAETGFNEAALIDGIMDVEEKIDDVTRKAIDDEALRELDEAFEGGYSLPGPDSDTGAPGRGLGDALFD
jgi:hypothetical protein